MERFGLLLSNPKLEPVPYEFRVSPNAQGTLNYFATLISDEDSAYSFGLVLTIDFHNVRATTIHEMSNWLDSVEI